MAIRRNLSTPDLRAKWAAVAEKARQMPEWEKVWLLPGDRDSEDEFEDWGRYSYWP